jgi:hypothetical protein
VKKVLARLARHGVLAVLLAGCTDEKPEGKAMMPKADTVISVSAAIAAHDTAEQIKALLPCRATVEERQPCYAVFRTADGKRFAIGSPGATAEVVRFLGTLKEGESYQFPGMFVDYLKNHPQKEER